MGAARRAQRAGERGAAAHQSAVAAAVGGAVPPPRRRRPPPRMLSGRGAGARRRHPSPRHLRCSCLYAAVSSLRQQVAVNAYAAAGSPRGRQRRRRDRVNVLPPPTTPRRCGPRPGGGRRATHPARAIPLYFLHFPPHPPAVCWWRVRPDREAPTVATATDKGRGRPPTHAASRGRPPTGRPPTAARRRRWLTRVGPQ